MFHGAPPQGSIRRFSAFSPLTERHRYCAEYGTNARFDCNVRLRLPIIRDLAQPAAAPLGATTSRYRSALTRPDKSLKAPNEMAFDRAA
jgi:hypothetical protein